METHRPLPEADPLAVDPPLAGDSLSRTIAIAKRELEQMMDLNPQGMLLIDDDGTIVRANRSVVVLTGVDGFDALLGKPLATVFSSGDDHFFDQMLDSAGGVAAYETYINLPDGFVRELSFTVVGAGASGSVRVIMVVDITGEKERVADEEREHKKEAVSALIGGLMHNINQPLTVVMVTAKLMELGLEKPLPDVEELRENLATISDLIMQVKSMMESVEAATDYVTEEYIEGKRILDIHHLAQAKASAPDG
ncbi:MAG: PAS domain-containing protein [Lentisphaerae bacterium]|nr:PAS domain-containing protein [Lentisphaerota bacterium]